MQLLRPCSSVVVGGTVLLCYAYLFSLAVLSKSSVLLCFPLLPSAALSRVLVPDPEAVAEAAEAAPHCTTMAVFAIFCPSTT
jgi:hypothetical protein